MAKPILNETTIQDYMKRNKCGREDAIDLIKYDIAVEEGAETEYDLTEEQQNNVREMTRKVDHAKSGPRKSGRKPNEAKEAIVAELADYLSMSEEYNDVTITNPNRMIHFARGDKEYDLQLIEKRKK